MPRRTLARRFEPRYGVSQVMLDAEAKWVGRELDDYLLSSISELREKLRERQAGFAAAEEQLAAHLTSLPDRERLALKCMLARDAFHIAKLYETFLRSASAVEQVTGTSTPTPEELDQNDEPRSVLAFTNSLFEP